MDAPPTKPTEASRKADLAEAHVMQLLTDAAAMRLDLSEDEAAYDLPFISRKLALCSTFQERLSDIMMKLTMTAIESTKVSAASRQLLELREAQLKQSSEYQALDRGERNPWLQEKLREQRDTTDRWTTLKKVVSEVREAVSERAQTMKRLDSDLRLHSRLYEAKVIPAGATSSRAYTGPRESGLDIT